MKNIKTVQTMMDILPQTWLVLAIIAIFFFVTGNKFSAYIIICAIALMVIAYIVLSLFYWRCPHCQQYLPLKHAGKISHCPHCHKPIK